MTLDSTEANLYDECMSIRSKQEHMCLSISPKTNVCKPGFIQHPRQGIYPTRMDQELKPWLLQVCD